MEMNAAAPPPGGELDRAGGRPHRQGTGGRGHRDQAGASRTSSPSGVYALELLTCLADSNVPTGTGPGLEAENRCGEDKNGAVALRRGRAGPAGGLRDGATRRAAGHGVTPGHGHVVHTSDGHVPACHHDEPLRADYDRGAAADRATDDRRGRPEDLRLS